MQMTIRGISKAIRQKLEERAKAEGKSLNEVAVEAMQAGLGLSAEPKVHHDLDWFFGSGALEPEVLEAIKEHDVVHPDDLK